MKPAFAVADRGGLHLDGRRFRRTPAKPASAA